MNMTTLQNEFETNEWHEAARAAGVHLASLLPCPAELRLKLVGAQGDELYHDECWDVLMRSAAVSWGLLYGLAEGWGARLGGVRIES